MKRLLPLLSLLLVMSLATEARAWKLWGFAWEMEDLPVVWYAPDPADADVLTLPPGMALELTQASFDHWRDDVPCSPLDAVFGGYVTNTGEPESDGNVEFYWEDADGQLGSGTLARTSMFANYDNTIHYNGEEFWPVGDFDIIFNDGLNWGTPDDIYGGGCTDQYSFEAVNTHEIGHGYGLGHSCESDEACTDPLKRDAVMYWAIGKCETGRELPNEDDIAGINAIYGVHTDIEASETMGSAPLEVSFSVPEDLSDDIETYHWTFGDGSDVSGDAAPTHVYQAEGQYTVSLTVTGSNDECGEFENTVRKVGHVLVCDLPQPDFSIINLGDNQVRFSNDTLSSTFGCIHEFTWNLGDGTEVSSFEPTHSYGSTGAYTVSLTASGPAGSEAAKKEIEVKGSADPRDDEPLLCDAGASGRPGPLGWLASVALGLAFLLRRR